MDLVMREDFDVQKKLLEAAQTKLAELEARHDRLEAGGGKAGELSLTGERRPIRGALAMALSARRCGRAFVLPAGNAPQGALAEGARILPARSLLEVVGHLADEARLAEYSGSAQVMRPGYPDFSEVKGQ